jgi:mono/diheme cytochrome c family protein
MPKTKSCKLPKLDVLLTTAAVSFVVGVSFTAAHNPSRAENHGDVHDVEVRKINYTPTPVSAESKKGKQLFEQLSCANCHAVSGKGGCLGPPLDAVGAVRDERFLVSRISSDKARIAQFENMYGMPELMPHPRLAEPKAAAIAKYLLALPAPEGGFYVTPHTVPANIPTTAQPGFKPQPTSSKSRQGAKLFNEQGCAACHSIAGVGGWFGPALDGIGGRRSIEFIRAQVENPQANKDKTRPDPREMPALMPKFNLPAQDVEKITAFLLSLADRKKSR